MLGVFVRTVSVLLLSVFLYTSCSTQATSRYYGKTQAPKDNILRYISGSEPESLDPPVATGQPEARVMMALYDSLVEYDPKTLDPIPSVAESWEVGSGGTEYVFHLRKNARFSNGDPIKAQDFVFSFRRAVSPELAALNGYLGYYIKYAEPYNGGQMFVRDKGGRFLLKDDLAETKTEPAKVSDDLPGETEFHKYIDGPERLTVPAT